MYQKIVVPLDGSKLVECVLPHMETVAKGCGTEEIILVTVTERIITSSGITQI
ncbi:MAG: universal stress protein, partial [Dehalococcoidia bacterium]